MTKYLCTLMVLCSSLICVAQGSGTNNNKNAYSTPSRDYFMFQLGYENWSGTPDSIKIAGIGRAVNTYLCYDFPIMKSNFSFAAGAGIGISNIYLKNQAAIISGTDTQIQFIAEPIDYKKFKLTTAYLEAPFEFRFFGNKNNRNKGFKAALGLRVGVLVSSHTKSKRVYNSKPIVEKVSTKRYLETMRYAATFRMGYGNFSVYGAYNIGNLFRINNGPENIKPYQIGICITGL